MSIKLPMFAFAIFCMLVPAQSGAQPATTSLRASASKDGYVLQWLLPTRSVGLFRPGLAIVLRPGAVMYEVNDREEFSDAPPIYKNGDMLISSALAARLAKLASTESGSEGSLASGQSMHITVGRQPASGTISMDVRPLHGSEAVSISGHTPANAPVTITLLATISSDLPTVVVSRHETQPDVNGNFQTTISIASNYERNTILHVVATSVAGVTPASAQLIVGPPNAGETVPFESQPQDF